MGEGVTVKIFCTSDYLVAKCLKELSYLRMSYIFFFYKNKCSKFADLFWDDKWLSAVCYLADMFKKINTLHLSFQSKGDILRISTKSFTVL